MTEGLRLDVSHGSWRPAVR